MSPSLERKGAKRAGVSIGLVALLALAGCGGTSQPPPAPERRPFAGALASRTIALPADDVRFPEPAGALLNRNCLSCHSASMILYQPRLTEAQWQATVTKMRDAYKAPIAEADMAGIVRELVALDASAGAAH
jgi:hypothetical protein